MHYATEHSHAVGPAGMRRAPDVSLLLPGLLLLLLMAAPQAEEGLTVTHVSSVLVDNVCYVDASIDLNLHEDLLEALDHGVDLDVRIIIRVREQRKWRRDRLYREQVIAYKLDHLLLSNVYIVTNSENSRQRQFDRLENALNYLGTLERHPLFTDENIAQAASLTGSLKTEISVANLPPPLKPVASLFNKWQSDSRWHRWTIAP